MCDCFHLAFPNWHAASGTGAGRRLRGPEAGTEDDSICDEPSQFTEGERPRPQGSSPVEEFPETEKYSDSECGAEHDPHHKSGSGKKTKKSGLGSMFEKRSTPKMSKLKEVHSPESGVIVKTAKDGYAEGLIYGGGGKEGIFIKEVVPESPASKNLRVKEGDQLLSATVYFDNVSYEDAIQILEHAQAYKVKLCLKRKPDVSETEATLESDVIPEDEIYAPDMREQGKTKRRGDARISWPKFPSFGKGRKSRFTRSHSSSEADEQRKLELSPTTSDTESPIKSQDALKGKKKHKIKLSALTKRGRISSSEDQDTDTPTAGQISGKVLQSDMPSPECLESPTGETREVCVTEGLKAVEDLRLQQNDQSPTEPHTVQHKVELIAIDSTLKTADLTVALADKETPTGIKSPDEKKKKKERSELKMKLLGKDKSHKKDAKAKSSPKRLKTLGASIEIADQPEHQKPDAIAKPDATTQIISGDTSRVILATSVTTPQVELDLTKQKQETKTFKLPKVGFGDVSAEETIQKMETTVEESTTKTEQLRTDSKEVSEDPYDRLAKSGLTRTKLPKREDIEIPGMEDMSMKTTAKAIKEPKAAFTKQHEEIQADTVPLSIDVDSVKEAVSKLPGFKLPKVDTAGVPIPEEITVIDANAQRISVKTPTKVVDTKSKHEAHFTRFDMTASPEISKTTVKLPKIAPADLTSEELLIETKVDVKKKHKAKGKQSDKEIKTEVYKREDIIIPGKESGQGEASVRAQYTEKTQGAEGIKSESAATLSPDKKSKKAKMMTPSFGIGKLDIKIPDVGIDLSRQNISKQTGDGVKGDKIIIHQEVKISKSETKKGKELAGGLTSDVKIPEIDGIEYIDSVGGSPAKTDGGVNLIGIDLDAAKAKAGISFPEIKGEVKDGEAQEHTIKLQTSGAVTVDISGQVPDSEKNIDGTEIKTPEKEGKGSKFKLPNVSISMPKVKGHKIDLGLSKKDADVTLPEAKAEVKLPEGPEVDVSLGMVDVSIPEKKMDVEIPEPEIKPLQTDVELDGQGLKFKVPKLGIKMPKIKGPEFDLSSSKKDREVTLTGAKAEGKLPEAPGVDVSLPKVDVSIPQQKVEIKTTEIEVKTPQTAGELDGQGSRFKMPKFGITMPTVKAGEIDLSLSNKDVDMTLPEAKAEVELKEPSAQIEVKAPEVKVAAKGPEGSPLKFKMPTFKLPKFGAGSPNFPSEVPDMEKDVKIDGPDINIPEDDSAVNIEAPSLDIEGPSIDIKTTGTEQDGKGGKFKVPHLGFSMPKVKGPKIDLSLSKKDVDVTSPGGKAEIKLPEADLGKIDVSLPEAKIEVPEAKAEVKLPEAPKTDVHIKSPECEAEIDGHGGKFKMPKFGVKMPKVKAPEVDLSFSKKDTDVKLPEAKGHVALPEAKMELKKPELETPSLQAEVELDGQGEKFKMPKFGIKMPKVKGPEIDLSLSKKDANVTLPETKVEVKLPDAPKVDMSLVKAEALIPEAKTEIEEPQLEIKSLQTEVQGQGGKFKMPKLGMSIPKVKGPEVHLGFSKKDVDVTLPEAKADVSLPDVELKAPSAKVETKALEIEAKDIEGSSSKIKLPSLSFPVEKMPDVDLSFSKKGADVTLPEPKAEAEVPEAPKVAVDVKPPEIEAESHGQGRKFKMPKFGITMPKMSGPEIDLSLSKKDVDVTLPEAKAEASLPDMELKEPSAKVDIKATKVKVAAKGPEGSPSKFKMPTFKLPKFGVGTPTIQVPDLDKDVKVSGDDIDIPEDSSAISIPQAEMGVAKVEVKLPEAPAVVMKPPEIEAEIGGQGSKFKMPKLGITMPKVKGPEIDLSLSKKDEDVTLPEAKVDVKVPDVELKDAKVEVKAPEIKLATKGTEGSPSKFKMPTFKLPRFGVGTPNVSVEAPEGKADIKLPEADLGKVDISVPQAKIQVPEAEVEVQLPEVPKTDVEIKSPEFEAEIDGHGGKFKMPKFGIKMPKMKAPEVDLSFSKKDIDVKLPETTAHVTLPEVDLGKVDVSVPEAKMEIKKPELEMQSLQTEAELDAQGEKFRMPKFGIKMPKIKGPEIDLSLSKKDADVTLPQAKAEVEIPEAPKIAVDVKLPETEAEIDGQGSKFKMPKLGITMPKVKGPEIDLSLSKKDVDVTLPEAKAEVKVPDVELKDAKVEVKAPEIKLVTKGTEASPSKFKMPSFRLPRFGVGTPNISVEAPEGKADIKLPEADLGKVDISVPQAKIQVPEAEVEVQLPEVPKTDVEIKSPEFEAEIDGHGGKFKMPKFGVKMPKMKAPEVDLSFSKKDIDVKLPETTAHVTLPEVDLGKVDVSVPEAKMEIKKPELEMQSLQTEAELDAQGEKFKMPKFGIKMPKIKGPEIDLSLSKKDAYVTLPQAKAEVEIPEAPKIAVDVKPPEIEAEIDGQGSKFKMPKLGITMPKVKGPEIDLSLPKKDVDVTLPEAKAEVKVPDVELKDVKVEVKAPEIKLATKGTEGSPSKFKMPTFKLPRFGVGTPNVSVEAQGAKADIKLPEADLGKVDISVPQAKIQVPEAEVEVQLPEVPKADMEIKSPEFEAETDGQRGKFKMPKFGISIPKVKGPEIDLTLSKKDIDVTMPQAKAEVKLPDVELKESSAKVEIKAPEIEAQVGHMEGSPSKFKLPTFKLPKFGATTPNVSAEVPDMDINVEGAPKIDVSLMKKDIDVKTPEVKAEVKLPQAPEVDVNLGKVDVSIPEVKMEIKKPELEKKSLQSEGEVDVQGGRFKMPKFGISLPKVKGPEIDVSLSRKDVDVTLPEAKAEVNLPDVELKEPSAKVETKPPEIEAQLGSVKGSPSKFKMPTFKFPKFGTATPNISAEVPDVDKESQIDGMDISLPHADVDIPKVQAEIHLPEVEVKEPSGGVAIDQQPVAEVEAKLKKPRFSLPKLSFSKPSVKAPEVDVSIQDVNVTIPEGKVEVKGGEVDVKLPECEAEVDGQGGKFKMPKFGFAVPKVTGPEIDLSLSKKDVDVTLPVAKAEVKLPDDELKGPSAEMEMKSPEIKVSTKDTEASPSKFKMPTFKLPKFGVGMPSATVEVPDTQKDVKIDGADIKIPEEVLKIDVKAPTIDTEGPSIDIKTAGMEHEGKGSKFKMPKFGITTAKVRGPEIDVSPSKKNVDVTLPEAKAEVKLPDVELKEPSGKMKSPEIKVSTKDTEVSPSKFKMPTFKLPKFGVGMPSATVEVPETQKDFKIDGDDIKFPEEVLTVDIAAPSTDSEGPTIDIKTVEVEHEDKGSKFKMPKFGFTMPKVTGPEIDLNVSKKDVDVTLPEAKAEVKLPELKEPSAQVEVNISTKGTEESPSKFKMPTFKLPKFGASAPQVSVEVPDSDKDIKVDGQDLKLPQTKAEIKLPDVEIKEPVGSVSVSGAPMLEGDAKLKKTRFSLPKFSFSKQSGPDVDASLPEGSIEVQQPEVQAQIPEVDVEIHGQEGKFKLPKFGISMPKVKGPEIDLSLSKKDVDVTLPEAKAEIQPLKAETKQPSAKVKLKAPELETITGDVEGSPSKLKMPSFTLPKFGAATPKVGVEVADVDKDIKIDGAKAEVPKGGAAVDVTAPSIDAKGLSVDVKAKGSEHEGSGSKFKLPSFGISVPKVKGPEIDISVSKKDVDVSLPEAKVEVKLPDVKAKEPEGAISVPDAPTVEAEVQMKRSNWTFPKFSFSRSGGKAPDVDVNLETPKVDVTSPEVKAEVSLPDVKVQGPSAAVSVEEPSAADVDANLKKAKFSLPRFSFSKAGGKDSEVSADLPHVDVSLPEGEVKVKQPEVEITATQGDVELHGQESKFKIPKFGISMPKVKAPEIDLSLSKKDVDVTLPEAKAEVKLPEVKSKQSSAKADIKTPETETLKGNVEGSPSKLKMPSFTLPRFGAATPKVGVEVADVDKDIKIDGAKAEVPKGGAAVDVTAPSIDAKGLSVDVKAKGSEHEGSGSKFKLPSFGISVPKVKGPEIDISVSKKDVDVSLPEAKVEVKLPDVKAKEPEGAISVPDAPTVEAEVQMKRSNWTFPKFSFSRSGDKTPEVDVNLETPKVDVTSPEVKAEVSLPDVKVKGPSAAVSVGEPSAADVDANLKKAKFSLPKFSLSKAGGKDSEVSADLPHVDVSLPEGEVKVKLPEVEIKAPEHEAEGQGSKFKLPKFGIALPKVKGPEQDLKAPQTDIDITLPDVKAEVKFPKTGAKESVASVDVKAPEAETKTKDVGGSPSKFKMPTMKMPKFGGASYDVTVEAPDVHKVAETDGATQKEDITVTIKGPSLDIKTDVSKVAVTESESPKTETDVGLGSPSKFKLPLFKMPKLSFSRPKPEDENVPVETESKEDQLEGEPKGESKSPKMTLTSFGEILKNIDVEFDVPQIDTVEESHETSKDVLERDGPGGKQSETKERETSTKQDATKSPERTGWFKFPKFGLSSPSEPVKTSEKVKEEKSPEDEEISTTCSVQSSDAFADISSAMTSEHVGLSLSSPTKVTVKYSDPNADTGHGETHTNIITSTTRTELISVEPNLPEKITILSSGVSSSSEDTLRLESGKIHVITSNIQANPESQHAKLLTAVQVQPAGGLHLKSDVNEAASWTVEDTLGGKTTVFEKHFISETSSESKETIVITKQITRMSSEPISGETASSIQRLKDSVHSEKMRFFDGAEK